MNIPALRQRLGRDVCKALPGLHIFSGCDMTSGFGGKSKFAFSALLKVGNIFYNTMQELGNDLEMSEKLITEWEASVCKLYKHEETDVNQVCYNMLAKGAEYHDIPPTKDCLLLHIKRLLSLPMEQGLGG